MMVRATTLCFVDGSRRRMGEEFEYHGNVESYPWLQPIIDAAPPTAEVGEESPASPPERKQYSCEFCGFVTHHKLALSGHMRQHRSKKK